MKIANLEVYGVIYKITNVINNKVYIGQTVIGFNKRYSYKGEDIERIYKWHKNNKESNVSYNQHLLKSIEKYGYKNFQVNKVFDVAFSKEELNIKESCWINIYKSNNSRFGYNKRDGGANGKYSVETIRKMSGENHHFFNIKGKDNPSSKEIICLNDRMCFYGSSEVASYYGIKGVSSINDCCLHGRNFCTLKNKEKLIFVYKEEYINMDEFEIAERLKGINNLNFKFERKIVLLNTKEVFEKMSDCLKSYNLSSKGNLTLCCQGKRNYCGKHPETGEPLRWMYYDDYIKLHNKNINKGADYGGF